MYWFGIARSKISKKENPNTLLSTRSENSFSREKLGV
jgi:hypothetical protein